MKAAAIAEKVRVRFWLDAEDCFAVALDGSKRAIPMVTSDVGHALWSGLTEANRVPGLVQRLMKADLMTSYGCRSLSSASPF
jgi:glycogen debranching enzyme